MAQLKNLLVNGATRIVGTLYANLLKTNTIEVPTEQGGIIYGPGSSGQVLKSDGANVYWGTVSSSGGAILYGVCDTAAETVNKTVSIPDVTELVTGLTIQVKFTNTNSATNPTLQVNSLTAKPMYLYGTTVFSTTAATTGWNAGSVVQLTYDGTGWIRDQGYNTNNTYTSMTVAEYQAGTGTTARSITPQRLVGAINYHAPMPTAPSSDGTYVLQVSVSSGTPTYSWVSLATWQGGSY